MKSTNLAAAGALTFMFLSGILAMLPASSAVTTVNIAIPAGAGTPESGWASGSTTLDGFSPLSVTVVIGVNNSVTWTNDDTVFHTVTVHSGGPTSTSGGSTASALADSGQLTQGKTFSYTFTTAGTYTITCDYHAWMIGTVTVDAASTTTTTPEFPVALLGVILFAVVALVLIAAPKVRPLGPKPAPV